MNGKEIIADMLFVWSQVNLENPIAKEILKTVQPTDRITQSTMALKWIVGSGEELIKNRIAFLQKWNEHHIIGAYQIQNWQLSAGTMTMEQATALYQEYQKIK